MDNMNDVFEFLDYTEKKGLLNKNTVQSRKTAFKNLIGILDEQQKSVDYMRDNMEVIKTRFQNLNREVSGKTVDIYINRTKLVLSDYFAWKQDRSKWEKELSNRSAKEPTQAKLDKNSAKLKTENQKKNNENNNPFEQDNFREISFPINKGREFKVFMPEDLITYDELQKIGLFLLPYCKDFGSKNHTNARFPIIPFGE